MTNFIIISVENYRKGKNVEEPWDKTKIPIPNLPPQFIWMQVCKFRSIPFTLLA